MGVDQGMKVPGLLDSTRMMGLGLETLCVYMGPVADALG